MPGGAHMYPCLTHASWGLHKYGPNDILMINSAMAIITTQAEHAMYTVHGQKLVTNMTAK